ncbi:MAG TPA: sugar acetyltransferase, partial [Methylomirabilota bacterium]|nr:sugar acetyltransferase [Methylomirabilota bacterium]
MTPSTAALEIVVIGAGGHGREVYGYIRELAAAGSPVAFAGFVDEKKRSTDGPPRVLGDFAALRAWCEPRAASDLRYITAIGDNRARARFVAEVEARTPLRPWVLQHPRAHLGPEVVVGDGTCIAPGATLTTRVRVGRHGIVNVHASVSHDAEVADFVNIN